MIELTHISKVYDGPNRVEALKDISLSVKEGEIFGVIGQSGAGKSTLIRCINMLERPTSGSVVVDGVDLTKLNEKDLREQRKNIGMIFQHFNLLSSRTVYDNVAFPLELQGMSKAEIKERILPILDIVKLGDRLNNYPAVRNSVSVLPVLWPAIRKCFFATKLRPLWIRRQPNPFWNCLKILMKN